MIEQSTQGHQYRLRSGSRWLIVILLSVIATCLLIEAGFSTSTAGGEVGVGGEKNIFAVAGQVSPDTHGIYLVDLDHGTICVYQYVPSTRRLRLMAARTFVYDVQLDDYNNEKPLPREVKELVERQRRLRETSSRPGK